MLDDLAGVIETLQGRIRNYGDTLRQNEIRTRVALIDPLLQALGWDVADPGLATPEYEISGQRVDYALLGPEGKPAATVEAKKLGEPLASHRMQMLNYSNAAGIAYAGLTDGNQWELYEVFKQVTLEERRLLDLRLLDTPAHECALKLLLLWRPNLATGQPVAAGKPISTSLVEPPPAPPATVTPAAVVVNTQLPVSPPTVPAAAAGWVRLSDWQPEPGTRAPTTVRFANGTTESLGAWRNIPLEVAEFLIRNGKLSAGNCPVPMSGGARYVVHSVAVHSNGKDFTEKRKLSNNLFCETNVGAARALSYAKSLLHHCGVDPGQVWLKLD